VEGGVDKGKAGLGALIGGVLGAVIDGKKGAVIGALVGGGGTLVAWSGDEVELPAGTLLTVELERPLVLARRQGESDPAALVACRILPLPLRTGPG
jgi:hypothetical protein